MPSIQNQVAQTPKAQGMTIQDYVKKMEGQIANALPTVITPERFTRMVLSAISNNPKLQECTPKSFLSAMMQAAQLGIEPNTNLGQGYILPFRNHGVMEAQFQLGYKGLLDLAYRSGEVDTATAQVVYSNDFFEYEFGLEPKLKHKPSFGDRGEPKYVYAMYRTKNGGYGFDVDTVEAIRKFAQEKSKSYSSGPWQTDFLEMAKKTMLKRVLKLAPLKSEFQRGLAQDETVKYDISKDMDLIPDKTAYESTETDVDTETGEILGTEMPKSE